MRLMNPFPTSRRKSRRSSPVELSERRLEKVIKALASFRDERELARLSPRIKLHGAVTMLPFAHGRSGLARTVGVYDISSAGVAVVDTQPVPLGTQFKMLIPRRFRRPIEVLCTVRHCRRSDDAFIVGAEYGVSWLETLGTLVAPPTPAPRSAPFANPCDDDVVTAAVA